MLGESNRSWRAKNQAWAWRTASRQEPSAERAWARKSQKVVQGGKEPLAEAAWRRRGAGQPGAEELDHLREGCLRQLSEAGGKTGCALVHGGLLEKG